MKSDQILLSGWLRSLLVVLPLMAVTDMAESGNDNDDPAFLQFDDAVLEQPVPHPNWFKPNLQDLESDLKEAVAHGKRLVTYFGQPHCAYCKALMKNDFGQSDITEYTREHFDIVPINIWNTEELVGPKGKTTTERDYAVQEKVNFTPSLIFYDEDGNVVLKLRGYYPPYKFRAALEYVADRHYQKETFADYLDRADPTASFEPGGLNEEDFFEPPPYALDRSRFPADQPLLVLFEQGNCHACDILHTEPLRDPRMDRNLDAFEVVQLDIRADTPVITPGGEATTAKKWAKKLGIFYTPTLVFFDEHGQEIIRVDSVVHFNRLLYVTEYVLSHAYQMEPLFQSWRAKNREKSQATKSTPAP